MLPSFWFNRRSRSIQRGQQLTEALRNFYLIPNVALPYKSDISQYCLYNARLLVGDSFHKLACIINNTLCGELVVQCRSSAFRLLLPFTKVIYLCEECRSIVKLNNFVDWFYKPVTFKTCFQYPESFYKVEYFNSNSNCMGLIQTA